MYRIFSIFLLSFLQISAPAAPLPAPPQIEARSYLLLDHLSGRVLVESNADEQLAPASITKVMTAYVVASELAEGNISPEDQVTISEKAWRMKGSRMFIEVGSRVTVDELMQGMIIQSGNDASVALAEHVAGSEESFASLMNHHAGLLGMSNSHFTNSTGWPDEQLHSTARDIALLTSALIRNFPETYALFQVKEMTYNEITQQNRNKLLWRDDSVDGVKTGYTKDAGYCLAASAQRDEMRLISVVMRTDSPKARERASQSLLNFGFRFYETRMLYPLGSAVAQTRIWKGTTEQMQLGLQQELALTLPRGRFKDLDASMSIPDELVAPISAGATIGGYTLSLDDEVLLERPLVALHAVPEAGLVKRLKDQVRMLLD